MSRVDQLDPAFRGKVEMLLTRLRSLGWEPHIASAWRSPEEQAKLKAQGRTQVDFSFHNARCASGAPCALAVDIVDARYGWGTSGKDPPKDAMTAAFFLALGQEAKLLGMTWGGDWKKSGSFWAPYGMGWDPAHVQMYPNSRLAEVRTASMTAAGQLVQGELQAAAETLLNASQDVLTQTQAQMQTPGPTRRSWRQRHATAVGVVTGVLVGAVALLALRGRDARP